MMNNEFRSTVLSIQEASKAIRDQGAGLADAREFALDIYADAQRLLHLIADQLESSWLATGRKRLQLSWLDLNAIIVDVVNHLRLTTHHLIRLQLARALPVLMGDQKKLASVISHLLKDAMQYSPDGGEIYVSSVVEGHVVHICIRDQGAGVSSAELEQLFADRPRSDGETVRQPLQSLPTVREIVQMHGGTIWAESSPGVGSAIHFTIPFIERN
jgi:two-component system, OmpR family, sensor histidine kinase VicK